jgi:transcriptional regulator with XRE-family HTH domain
VGVKMKENDMKNNENYEKSKILGRNIKNIRKQKGLTEMQLGKMIGKSRKFISLIEYPQYNKEIYIDSLFDISRALDVDIYYFFIGIE